MLSPLYCNIPKLLQAIVRLQKLGVQVKANKNNLLNNALKFTEHGGVTLSVETLARTDETIEVKFSISDTGIGIAEQIQFHAS